MFSRDYAVQNWPRIDYFTAFSPRFAALPGGGQSQTRSLGENELAFFHAHAMERVVRDQQVAVEIRVIDQRRKMRGGGDRHGTRDHAAEHRFHAEGLRDLDHTVGFQHAAALIELDVDAVEGIAQFGNVARALAGFVGDHGDVDAAAHPAGFLDHLGGHGLFDELDAHLFQPVDFADGLFLIGPAFVGIHAQRLLGDAAHGFNGGFVGREANLYFEDGEIRGLNGLLFGNFRSVDADGECGERGIGGVQAEIGIERNLQLLPDPVHQGDIDGGLAGPFARHALEDLRHDL